jgi:hypothetical protein
VPIIFLQILHWNQLRGKLHFEMEFSKRILSDHVNERFSILFPSKFIQGTWCLLSDDFQVETKRATS